MPNENEKRRPVDAILIARGLVERESIWQRRVVDAKELEHFARDRGVSFSARNIEELWQLGLLRADIITSPRRLRRNQLIPVGSVANEARAYADARRLRARRLGWFGAATRLRVLDPLVKPCFHPYRLYVLSQLVRVLEPRLGPAFFFHGGLIGEAIAHWTSGLRRWSSSKEWLVSVEHWNDVVELAVIAEPSALPTINKRLVRGGWMSEEEFEHLRADHWHQVAQHYRQIGGELIREVHRELCQHAETMEPNRDVHTLLRLADSQVREKTKGRLGASVIILEAAEVVRLAAEAAMEIELPQEHQDGLGSLDRGIRAAQNGSHRLLDGNRIEANEFLRGLALDRSVRVRWYVEGDTEYWAIREFLIDYPASTVELINLRGQVVSRSDIAFRDDLLNDDQERIFSMISIDGDREDFLRAVRKAARDDIFCGQFYIALPDFELQNFTVEELEVVLWNLAVENGASPDERELLQGALQGAASGEALLNAAKRAIPSLRLVSKGRDWGRRLAQFAKEQWDHPSGGLRPFLEAVTDALRSPQYDYLYSRASTCIDPESGKAVRRASSENLPRV